MSILDSLLGGSSNDEQSTDSSSQTQDLDSVFATNPTAGLHASDILHSSESSSDGSDESSFTGIGDVGLDLSAPTLLGISSSSSDDQFSSRDSDGGGGGLLGGLI